MEHSVKSLAKTLNRLDIKEMVALKKEVALKNRDDKQQLQNDWALEFGSKKAGKVRLKFGGLLTGATAPTSIFLSNIV